jgi:hypothetical protein
LPQRGQEQDSPAPIDPESVVIISTHSSMFSLQFELLFSQPGVNH